LLQIFKNNNFILFLSNAETPGKGTPMRVLIFSKFNPYPPTAGGSIRMWTLAKSLMKRGVEVKFVTPVLKSPKNMIFEGIPVYEVRISIVYVLFGFIFRKVLPWKIGWLFHYLFMIKYFEKNLVKKVQNLAEDSNIIQCEFTWLYRIPAIVSRRRNLPFVLTFHDINSTFLSNYIEPRDFFSKFLISKIRDSEITAYNTANALVCFTKQDFDELVSMRISKNKIKIISHEISKFPITSTSSTVRPIVLFVGSGHAPNVAAAEIIISQIAPKVPEADFFIVGNVGNFITRLNKPLNVVVTGFLPEKELIAIYKKATLGIVPLLCGAGMSVKTLEFLSIGLPVLTTSIGARGLTPDSSKSNALIINDNPFEYSERIKELIKNPKLREHLSAELVTLQKAS
jgi:glycosyltransferase involved in cell wall biosynthesis